MAAQRIFALCACAAALAMAAPVEKPAVSVSKVLSLEKGQTQEVFIPVDAAKDGPVSLEIDLQPLVQKQGMLKYMPWNRFATPSAVDVDVEIEKDVKMEALEVRVNSALTTTTIHIDGSHLFGANATDGSEDFVLSASTQPTALAIFLLTALPTICILGSAICLYMLFFAPVEQSEEPAPAYSTLVQTAKAAKIAEAERQMADLQRLARAAELPSYQECIERHGPVSVVPPLVRDL